MKKSQLEDEFRRQLKKAKISFKEQVGIEAPELISGKKRKFRWDFQVEDLFIEINGGTWHKGGHSTGTGIARDYLKARHALLHGHPSMLFSSQDVKEGVALAYVKAYLYSLY